MSSRTTSLTGRGSDSCSPASAGRVPSPPPPLSTPSSTAVAAAPSSSASPAHIEQLRQKLSNGLQSHPELRDLLGLCAESNDWSVEEARQRPDSITAMELFLLQVHRVPLVQYFPNLVTIKFMNIGLESTADFAPLTHVEELWLSDNNLRCVEGLENMTKLRRLFLQGNSITSLEGLPPLRHLRELWLSRNQLTRLTHLTPLRKLRALYVADNPIAVLDNAFSKDMTHLHDVNLSGCHIADIAQLCYLQQLPCLRNVWFSDPLFGDNPICRMSNYTTLTLAKLDSLDCLDGAYVTAEQRTLVESILGKKKTYYEMRLQLLDAHLVLLARHAEKCAAAERAETAHALAQLHSCLDPVEEELAERQVYQQPSAAQHDDDTANTGPLLGSRDGEPARPAVEASQLESLRMVLSRAIGTCEICEQKTLQRLAHAINAASVAALLLKERLVVELNTAGNVRLESLAPGSDAYTAAAEMLQDRFHKDLFSREFGITSVNVTGVRRVVNRGLRLRFDDRVKELHVDLANPQLRSRFVGLFGEVPPTLEGQSACLQHALLRGAAAGADGDDDHEWSSNNNGKSHHTDASYRPTPAGEGVPLTDSLFYADEARLRLFSEATSGAAATGRRGSNPAAAAAALSQVFIDRTAGDAVVCHGQLVMYRTYLGKAVCALGGGGGRKESVESPPQCFLRAAGPVPAKDYSAGITAAYRPTPEIKGPRSESADGVAAPQPSYVWYCFDRALVLADCVVDYTYLIPSSPSKRGAAPASPIAPPGVAAALNTEVAKAVVAAVCMPGSTATGGTSGSAEACHDVREDLLCCATPLLEFAQWCGDATATAIPSPPPPRNTSNGTSKNNNNNNNNGSNSGTSGGDPHQRRHRTSSVQQGNGGEHNTLKMVAAKETAEAITQATSVLGEDVVMRLLRPSEHNSADGSHELVASQPLQPHHVETYAARMHVEDHNLTLCVLRGLGVTAVWKDFACALLANVTTLDLSHNVIAELSWFALAKEAPKLQKLSLRSNRLTSLCLDGSRLPELRVLDLADNSLMHVEDFAAIRAAAPALEEMELRGNPMLARQVREEAEARLWVYLTMAPPSSTRTDTLVKLNQRTLGAYPGTLAVQRYRRACVLPSGGVGTSSRLSRALAYLSRRLRSPAAAAVALFSIDGSSVPARTAHAAMAQLEQWEAEETLDDVLAQEMTTIASLNAGNADEAVTQCLHECQELCWSYALLDDARGLVSLLPNLCRVVLRGHCLTNIDPVLQLTRLEFLDVAENHLGSLPCLAALRSLKELVVDFNALTSLPKEAGPLPSLRLLSASGNHITHVDAALFLDASHSTAVTTNTSNNTSGAGHSISHSSPPTTTYNTNNSSGSAGVAAVGDSGRVGPAGVSTTPQLEALHLLHNEIADMNVIYALREISSLLILSVAGNPCTTHDPSRTPRPESKDAKAVGEDTRQYLIHVFPQLRVLDGGAISAAEGSKAREVYAGKITTDLLIEKARGQPDTWATVRSLNLSQCTLTEINQLEPFVGLEVLQLQHNMIATVSGLSALLRLKALDLSHNRIGTAAWRSMNAHSNNAASAVSGTGSSGTAAAQPTMYIALGEALAPLKQLESLSIEGNQLTDLGVLKLRLPKLKFLNARGNDLQFLQRGLDYLPDLRELLLDQNKLRGFSADCFASNKKLMILSAENNALKSLEGLRTCTRLEQLRLGANRLGELRTALADLQTCPLRSLVLIGNPVARKSNYRGTVITYFAQLTELDRRAITADEREKAATARVTEYVAPPNVVIDMDFLTAAGTPPGGMSLQGVHNNNSNNGNGVGVLGNGLGGGVAGVGGTALPSRSRLSNPSAAIPNGVRRGGGTDRFNVNARSRPYRR